MDFAIHSSEPSVVSPLRLAQEPHHRVPAAFGCGGSGRGARPLTRSWQLAGENTAVFGLSEGEIEFSASSPGDGCVMVVVGKHFAFLLIVV